MSLGFLTESSLALKKSKEINVSSKSLAGLNSLISEKSLTLESATGRKSHKRGRTRDSKGQKSTKLGKKRRGNCIDYLDPKSNKGVEERNKSDMTLTITEKEKEKRRVAVLERKAKLYETLAQHHKHDAEVLAPDVLVDFLHKKDVKLIDNSEMNVMHKQPFKKASRMDENNISAIQSTETVHNDNIVQNILGTNSDNETTLENPMKNTVASQQHVQAYNADISTLHADGNYHTDSRLSKRNTVKQRYEFGLSTKEKQFLPQVIAEGNQYKANTAQMETVESRRVKMREKLALKLSIDNLLQNGMDSINDTKQ